MSASHLPYGLWPSPITPASLARGVRFSSLAWDSDGETLLWLEGRSAQGVLVGARQSDAPRDLTADLSVRARVGYGGGDVGAGDGQAYYAANGRIYRQALAGGAERAITPPYGDSASPTPSPDSRWLLYVHSLQGDDCLAIVDTEGRRWPQRLVEGGDFYMQPAWHPDGRRIAWVTWNHPLMPWDGAQLELGVLDTNGALPTLSQRRVLAGDERTAVAQPQFSPDGRYLSYLSDLTGWNNLYLCDLGSGQHRPLVVMDADLSGPAWTQGQRSYAWSPDSQSLYLICNREGRESLHRVDLVSGRMQPVPGLEEYTQLSQIEVSTAGHIALIASGPHTPARVLTIDAHDWRVHVRARSESESLPAEALSTPRQISWSAENGERVHGIHYPPVRVLPSTTSKPPLMVMVHGGPTGQSLTGHNPRAQFFATRGYAVLDVNYRGSTGYGRAYRDRLRGQWGVLDVQDTLSGALHLAEQGLVDRQRMAVMGGSAGGYTVLLALIQHPGVFRAGLCLYGVTNLFSLATDTHKFEQRYLDSLIGPLVEGRTLYHERSPLFHADRIQDALAIFQGEEDQVVPPSQAEAIVEALRRNRVPHEYHLYPGEGHGWRRAETIQMFWQAVDAFLRRHMLFT